MKTNPIRYNTIWCLFMTLFVAISCKDDTAIEPIYDGIKMRVNVTSGFEENGNISTARSSALGTSKRTATSLETQTQIISLGNGLDLIAELVPEQETTPLQTKQSTNGNKANAQTVTNALAEGTKYRLLVYDKNGNEVKRFDRTVGANSSAFAEFNLDATGEKTTYTFVAYSAGTADLPSLAANTTLSSAMVTVGGEKLMHFVQTIDLSYGSNELKVVLANKLSEITTILDGGGIGLNSIKSVGNIVFEAATHSGASLKLSDGTMTYSGTAKDKAVVFPAFSSGLTELNSFPTVLVHNQTATATLNVPYVEIAGVGKSKPFKIENIKIEPGVKYNLVLRLNKGQCMSDVTPETFAMSNSKSGCKITFIIFFQWFNYRMPLERCVPTDWPISLIYNMSWENPKENDIMGGTFEFSPTANAGVIMNITKLDNSFNMAINDPAENQNTANRKIATKEIQFQQGVGITRNIRFTGGGGYHGDGAIPNISEITNGTAANPVIRVSISSTGVVSIQGRKSNSDPTLYPMELYNNTSFNTVTWLSSGNKNNKVTITQTINSDTYIEGQVTGKRIANCK